VGREEGGGEGGREGGGEMGERGLSSTLQSCTPIGTAVSCPEKVH